MTEESRSIWAEGFKPIPYDTTRLESCMNGAKVAHAFHHVKFGLIQVVFNNSFLSHSELYWAGKQCDLRVDTIYAVENKEHPNMPRIQVNFYEGFEEYE